MACSICWCSRTTSARACRKRRYCSERQRMRSRWSTPSERMRVRPASLQESTMESAVRHSAVTTRVAATRLDLVDRAFDQFADLENLPQLAAILGRQVAKDLSLAGGDIGNRHGCTHGYGQSQHRVKLTLSRCISTVHEFFLNVQQKMRRREFLVRIVPCSVCEQ